METGSIHLMMQHMKEIGMRGKNMAKEKLSLKVEASLREVSSMTSKMDLEKCTIIHQGIFLRGSGKMM